MSTLETAPSRSPGTHILTVSVEDYFHSGNFEGAIERRHWDRLESRLERNIAEILGLFERFKATGTFFILGWVAEQQPELVARIARAGHEVASRGYWPRGLRGVAPEEFREDLERAREVLEAAGSSRVVGYRSPRRWLKEDDVWMLDVLAEEGYVYDSSINPVLRRFARDGGSFEVHRRRHSTMDLSLWEFPISTIGALGFRIAISGGNYIRQLPHTLLKRATAWWDQHRRTPLIFYFMPWELDREQPSIASISLLKRIRHYRNLSKTRWVLEEYLEKYSFQSMRDYLGMPRLLPVGEASRVPSVIDVRSAGPASLAAGLEPITVVIPLYNEERTIPYLHRTLRELRRRLGGTYRLHFNLVDDGSQDGTWRELEARFAGDRDCSLLRHPRNLGVARAVMTGIEQAATEVVCSIDSDCSYDPIVLEEMIPRISESDLVTASPYHPQGRVFNVPRWRLFLSRMLSRLYSTILRERLHTFTSICRVYRKSALSRIQISNGGFLGIAEMLIQVRLNGGNVLEHPATLEARLFGESKMKLVRTIWSHVKLLARLALRARKPRSPTKRSSRSTVQAP